MNNSSVSKLIENHAASMSNPPKGFRTLDVAFKFHQWCEDKGYTSYLHHEKAVKEFCKETGEQYKVWK